jgi:exosortase
MNNAAIFKGTPRLRSLAATALLLVSFSILYHAVIVKLIHDWATDDNYSHAFLIIPIALYFVWERRDRLARIKTKPNYLGLIFILLNIATLLVGILGSELFLTRISIIGITAGAILYILGWQCLKSLAFPILFLFLMIPLPAIILNQIAFPLQLIASRFGELSLNILGVPVLREGNIIQLPNISLEVVEACSGIRSLISMLTLGLLYGYFADKRMGIRTALCLATVPIAILANGFRVAITGVAAHYCNPKMAAGLFHEFSGWLIFVMAFIMLFFLHRLLRIFFPAIKESAGSVNHPKVEL